MATRRDGPRQFSEEGLGIAIAHRYCDLMSGGLTVPPDTGLGAEVMLRVLAITEPRDTP